MDYRDLANSADALPLDDRFELLRDVFYSIVGEIRDANRGKHQWQDQFKYNCLGHCEPGLFEETNWVTRYSSIDSLEKYVKDHMEDASEDDVCPSEDGVCHDCGKCKG